MYQTFFISCMFVSVYFAGQGEASLQANYLGCYRDDESRDVNGMAYNFPLYLTPSRCMAMCAQQGYQYFGLQWGLHCFCGDSYGSLGEADNCDMVCEGNGLEICGGDYANSVYSISGSAPVSDHIGCYTEDNFWDLQEGHFLNVPFMTVDVCMALCADVGTTYFGVDHGVHCHCGNSYGRYGPSDNCNAPCGGDASVPNCGGYYATSVYSIRPEVVVPSTAYLFTLPHNGHHYIVETTSQHHANGGQKYCQDNFGWSLAVINDQQTLDAISTELVNIQSTHGVTLGEVGSGVRSGVGLNGAVGMNKINAAGWNCAVLTDSAGVFSLVGQKCNAERAILCEGTPA